jgi:hypothetical protein
MLLQISSGLRVLGVLEATNEASGAVAAEGCTLEDFTVAALNDFDEGLGVKECVDGCFEGTRLVCGW